jgi:diadenylate cyclase
MLESFYIDYHLVRNVADVLLVAFLIYRSLLLVSGTRSLSVVVGLTGVGVVYIIAQQLGLLTLAWILGGVLNSIVLLILVLFQEEIRRALSKVGLHPIFRKIPEAGRSEIIKDIALAATKLAKARHGALIVIQREIGLDDVVEESVILDSLVSRKLLFSIFLKDSPLHDGAVLIVKDRIRAAGCVLPLSYNPDLDPNLGTRHRAALGLSERSDAVVVIVSEESATVSIAREGNLHRNLDQTTLADHLIKLLSEPSETADLLEDEQQ